MRKIVFNKLLWGELIRFCEAGYPKEVCGLFFGTVHGSERHVIHVEPLKNMLDGAHERRLKELVEANVVVLPKERVFKGGKFEFLIDPSEHYQKIEEAERQGLDQIGLFHSHPDHPAIPSAVDASQPFLADWSNMIVSVEQGKFSLARSWYREQENSSFQEEKIFVE